MVSVRLTPEEESRLEEIIAQAGFTQKSELIKHLINERWLSIQPGKTFLERMGGAPKHLLSGPSNLSSRAERKKRIKQHLEQRARRRAE
jgi:Arc/MetJ-type ribon-helix-helix transcriptional regulator